jgi:hypothetical protein
MNVIFHCDIICIENIHPEKFPSKFIFLPFYFMSLFRLISSAIVFILEFLTVSRNPGFCSRAFRPRDISIMERMR